LTAFNIINNCCGHKYVAQVYPSSTLLNQRQDHSLGLDTEHCGLGLVLGLGHTHVSPQQVHTQSQCATGILLAKLLKDARILATNTASACVLIYERYR